ncbi:ABC transporter ATP-binding protein [Leuconostoc litchii]|uniref:ABC transporter ATP-binding protein n=1 Tax=Leuconostoc litchii TaxID=1981069 RepID=A0A652NE13_9LACO|nr:ABC transporter ATP-binding protein [Leuconostoc litchii]TYC46007.1 ABC transporter ATP-binding protein [Leuconostoc litchii]
MIIKTKNFRVSYGDKTILSHINIEVPAGQFLAVLGENGAGKTSFIKALTGENNQTQGLLTVNAKQIGYVPQFRDISRDYPLSITEFVGLNFNQGSRLWFTKTEKSAVEQALKRMDLTTLGNQRLGLVSGGQKQRAFVAQALVKNPDLLILDESTASLDHEHKVQLLENVRHLQREKNMTVLFITHEIKLVADFADGYLLFENGQVKQGSSDELQTLTTDLTTRHSEDEVRNV